MCWIGGRFIGSTPTSFQYADVRRNAGEALHYGSDGGVIDGVRIHNIHEDSIGISMGKESNLGNRLVMIKDTWISYNKANAVENDHVVNLLIEDTLIDGSYNPISIDPGSAYGGTCKEDNNTLTISNTLVSTMKVIDKDNSRLDYLPWIKTHAVTKTCRVLPKIKIYNSIFAFEGWADSYPADTGPPGRLKRT